jgi:tetratricopeptide (TPR) repeat protein
MGDATVDALSLDAIVSAIGTALAHADPRPRDTLASLLREAAAVLPPPGSLPPDPGRPDPHRPDPHRPGPDRSGPGRAIPEDPAGRTLPDSARLLYEAAVASPALRRRLGDWVRATAAGSASHEGSHDASHDASYGSAHEGSYGHTISGGRQYGGVVQARDVGEIHWHTAPAPPPLPVPRQLIAAPRHLAGRARELAALDAGRRATASTAGGPLVAVVNGPAGVGKTALAAYWLHGLTADFPDGQLYADLRGHAPDGPADPREALGAFLRAFGLNPVPGDPAERAALWRSVTAGRHLAVMLDNAVSAAQVRPLLPASGRSVVVVTSRHRLTALGLEGAAFHPLGFLDAEACAQILAQRVGAGRTAAEPAAVRRVVDRCGGLALAVCVAAARMAARPGQPLSATAEALDREAEEPAGRRAGGGDDAAVQHALDHALDASYRLLPPDAAALYRMLGVLPFVELSQPVAAATAGLTPARAGRLLDALTDASLLEELPGARHRFHDLVRLHARGLALAHDSDGERTRALRRALEWYLATTTAAETLISPSHRDLDRDYTELPAPAGEPFDGERQALAWLAAEQHHLMTALRTAAAAGWDGLVWQLADAMWPLFLRLRPGSLWVEAHRIGLAAARRAGHTAGELRMLTSGGAGLRNTGSPGEAIDWFARALALARSTGDRRAEAQSLHGLGQSHLLSGRPAEATGWFEQALRLREEIGYARGAALSRLSLGDAALAAGRPEEAVTALNAARAALTALPDPYEAARALALLGRAHGEAGRTRLAEDCLRRAAAEFRDRGSAHWEARALEFLGDLLLDRVRPPDPAGARRAYERSRALYQAAGAPDTSRLASALARASAASAASGPSGPDSGVEPGTVPGAGPGGSASGGTEPDGTEPGGTGPGGTGPGAT